MLWIRSRHSYLASDESEKTLDYFPRIIYIYIYIYNRAIGQMSKVFANGPGNRGSIPGRVIPKTQKMVLDAALLSAQHYKVRIKGKVKQSWEWSNAYPYTVM